MSMRYTVLLEPEEDGGFVVSVPALPGCISQGDNDATCHTRVSSLQITSTSAQAHLGASGPTIEEFVQLRR